MALGQTVMFAKVGVAQDGVLAVEAAVAEVVVVALKLAKGNSIVSQDLIKRKWSKSVSWLWLGTPFVNKTVQSDLKYFIFATKE
jgi:hypothetical protein